MVEPGTPFLSEADIANLHDIVGQGLQTVQNFQSPEVLITFMRRTDAGREPIISDVQPISIRLLNQQEQESPVVAETMLRGIAKFWDHDLSFSPPQPEDRFSWLGHTCRVLIVHPPRLGTIQVDFQLIEGN